MGEIRYNGGAMRFLKLLSLMIFLGGVMLAEAHGYIVQTDPVDGSQLAESPALIQVWFSEALQAGSGSIQVVSGGGMMIEPQRVWHAEDDPTLLLAELPTQLPAGAYIVTAAAVVISDGHQPSGSFVFWVGQRQQAAAPQARPAYGGLLVLLGVIATVGAVGYSWLRRRPPLELPSMDS